MSQFWADQAADSWYTGKSSAEDLEQAREWIEYWVKLTTTRGQGQYDSPITWSSISCPALPREWAKDPAMKKRARMMLEFHLKPTLQVSFRSLRGVKMDFTRGETARLDGKPMDYERWPLFGGPFLEAAVHSEQLTIKYDRMRRILYFRNVTVTETGF